MFIQTLLPKTASVLGKLKHIQAISGFYLSGGTAVIDIACTKLMTVSMRGSKKDFIDMYFLLQTFTLDELMQKLKTKYQNISYNDTHILKSLVYFEDANAQPMPRMHKNVSWETVKQFIMQTVTPFV